MKPTRALSVRQPYAEQILRGSKKIEYRSRPTNIRERVYIYATIASAEKTEFAKARLKADELPQGFIVGSVEIVGCTQDGDDGYKWHLRNPERLARPLKPRKRPQPVWFKPF
jgi:hypothetical protein